MDSSYPNSEWCRKPGINRYLIILSSILFLLAVAFAISFAVILYKGNKYGEVCSTPGCINAAFKVLKYMDDSVDPCDDFYQFACGGFLKNTNIPEDEVSITSFGTIADSVTDQLKTIIQEQLPPHAPKTRQWIKKVYDLCMNTTALEVNGLATIESLMKDLGGWPLLEGDSWNEGKFDWKQSMYKLRKRGLGTGFFIGFSVGIDSKNSSRRIIKLGQAGLGLSREYLIKGIEDKLVKAYYDYMVDEAVLFGANRITALKEINETLELESELAKICLPREETRNKTAFSNLMTIEELQNNYPNIPWLEYITRILDIPDIDITEDEIVIVQVPKFITNVVALLRKTPKRIQANYILKGVAFSLIYSLPERFRQRKEEYHRVLNGRTEKAPRWKGCTAQATESAYLAIAASYVRKYFNEDAQKHAKEMVADVKNEFIKILKTSGWMDEETRQRALEKASAMVAHIGYPDELLDDKKIEKHYLNLDVTPDSYFKAMQALSLFVEDYYNKQLREPVNKTHWIRQSHPTVVNAFYFASENSIKLPAGILQDVFFSNDRPRYMNYGGIGFIIGHEITHGFDDGGKQFDKDGNLVDWWAEDTKAAFTKKAQCIIDQYGNYTVPEVNLTLNGINTQGENIADNGGIKEAYLAYQSWVQRHGVELKLPGLDYTPNQMFWISAANVWCAKFRIESLKQNVITGSHSPARFRVLGPFSNTEYFSNDFNCPLGSNMNPVSKCEVW